MTINTSDSDSVQPRPANRRKWVASIVVLVGAAGLLVALGRVTKVYPPAPLAAYPAISKDAVPQLMQCRQHPPLAGFKSPKPVIAADQQGQVVVLAAEYLDRQKWPKPRAGELTMVTLAGDGTPLEHITVQARDGDEAYQRAAKLIRAHAAKPLDAIALIEHAREEARQSDRNGQSKSASRGRDKTRHSKTQYPVFRNHRRHRTPVRKSSIGVLTPPLIEIPMSRNALR